VYEVAGDALFADAVATAVLECRFSAATEDGVGVAVEIPFSWDFPAPSVNVAGIVRAAGNRRPIPDLPIVVGDRLTRTAVDGTFEVRNLAPGTWTIRSAGSDWQLEEDPVDLVRGERVDFELYGVHQSGMTEAVGQYSTTRPTTSRRTVSRDEVRTSPGTMGDPVRAIQNSPGLVRTPFDAGWLLVRGGDIEDTGVFLDGVRVPLLFHLGGTTSILHPEMVESVHLSPGTFSPRYGGALAGIVDLVPRKLEGELRTVAGVNLAYSQAYTEAPVGDGGFAIAARRSYLDGVLALVLDPARASIAPRFWDWQMRVDRPHYGLMFVGMSDAIDTPSGTSGQTVTIHQTGMQVQGWSELRVGAGELRFQPWFAYQTRSLLTTLREETERQAFPGARVDLAMEFGPFHTLAGAEAEHRSYQLTRDGVGRAGTYGHMDPYLDVAVGDALRAEGGVRLETLFVADQLPRAAFSPRGAIRWQARPRIGIIGEVARLHQAPPPLFLLGFPDGPYLPLEEATMQSLGLRLEGAKASFDVDGWMRHSDRLTGFEEDGSIGQLQGSAWGLETLTQVQVGPTSGRLIYQHTRSFRREESGDGYEPWRFDQPDQVQLILAQSLPHDWTLSARFRYSSGFYLDPDVEKAFDILTQTEVEISADEAGRLPPYHTADLKVSRRFTWKSWRLDTYLDLQNLYFRRVVEPVINGIDDTDPVYGFGLPFLPIFGVEAEVWP
jgi:hypothetical protein